MNVVEKANIFHPTKYFLALTVRRHDDKVEAMNLKKMLGASIWNIKNDESHARDIKFLTRGNTRYNTPNT